MIWLNRKLIHEDESNEIIQNILITCRNIFLQIYESKRVLSLTDVEGCFPVYLVNWLWLFYRLLQGDQIPESFRHQLPVRGCSSSYKDGE